MSQQLAKMTRKDGKAVGRGIGINNGHNNLTIADIFKFVFLGKPIQNKVTYNGQSKNKNR